MVKLAMEQATKSLNDKISAQEEKIALQEARITTLEQDNIKLHDWLIDSDARHEELEQYGRRNSLRFHNVKITELQEQEQEEGVEEGDDDVADAADVADGDGESRSDVTPRVYSSVDTDQVIIKLCQDMSCWTWQSPRMTSCVHIPFAVPTDKGNHR